MSFDVSHCPSILSFSFSPSGQGLLSQSALQLNNQDPYAAAGYHNNQGLESVTGRSGQVGGAVHIYNQVHAYRFLFCFFSFSFFISMHPFLLLLTCCLTSSFPLISLHTLPSLGDIQPCSCPVSGHRLSLPVPERLICPTGPWQRFPHAH